ncbi:ABC transporter permease subunit [Leucobacter sp. CSA2]|uniref:ABC transporter permease subunit n=1 Tax=Leucobacter edaphi TaxID=2796472 RepID=A0A934QE08_9MICO|nr:ABC transporter permease subunit [Leucobacter edaphi]MBK0422518.1 ABC transporter permease subunit [Leucobacter edaphi]
MSAPNETTALPQEPDGRGPTDAPFSNGAPGIRPPGFFAGTWLIASLELRQRLRSRTLWVLAIVWFAIIGIVTFAIWWTLVGLASGDPDSGGALNAFPLFSVIVYFVLLFGTLVAPAISAGSIGAERTGGTLATTQVTLISTWSILAGKTLAAWITGVAFIVVASPFVVLSLVVGEFRPATLFFALIGLILQIGLFTAIGVGLSAMINSQVFAIVTAYLVVAALSIGTLIAFTLAVGTTVEYQQVTRTTFSDGYWQRTSECDPATDSGCLVPLPGECTTNTSEEQVVHNERFWWILTLNPYVVLADMATTGGQDHADGDLFTVISSGVRFLQIPATSDAADGCVVGEHPDARVEAQADDFSGQPYWWVGILLQSALAAGALAGGYARLRTPARSIPKGTRVA